MKKERPRSQNAHEDSNKHTITRAMSNSSVSKDATDTALVADTATDTAAKDKEEPRILCDELHPDVIYNVQNNMHTTAEEEDGTIMKLQIGPGQAINGRMDAGAKRGFSAFLDTDTGRLRIDAEDPQKAAFWLEVDVNRISEMTKKQKTEEAEAAESNESEESANSAE